MMQTVILFVCFYILAHLVGTWGDVILIKLDAKPSRLFSVAFGGCASLLLMMILCISGGMFMMPADTCVYVFAAAAALGGAAGFLVKKRISVKQDDKTGVLKGDIILTVVAVAAITSQVAAVMSYRFLNSAAVKNASLSAKVFEEGIISPGDPMAAFAGSLAHALGTHPLIVIYTMLPAVLITLYNLCYLELIRTVCQGWTRIAAYAALTVLNIWGYQSDVLIPFTLLISWAGTGVYIVHGLFTITAVILIRYLEGRPQTREEPGREDDEDYCKEWDMNKHRIINARNLAIALGVLALALICVVAVLNSKINRLYDATVNLQTDMNNRSSIYEFTDDGGNTAGYLIKNSDGKLAFVGGGAKDNAEALSRFFDRYGNTVSEWYVYGDDDENAGAMRELIYQAKINVEKVYVVDRKEITERQR